MRVILKVIDCSISPEEVFLFPVTGFPAVPEKGNLIDVYEIVRDLSNEETKARLDRLTWIVDHIFWCKDEISIYPEIICKCKETPQ